jgi:hypothetical protein
VQVIDTLALHLPKKQVYPPIAAFAKQSIQNPNPLFREAAVTLLGVIAEGCAEVMRKRLKELLPVVLAGLRDGVKEVRGQAAFALGLFAESLQPEMAEHYEQVLPPVFDLLKDQDDEVQVSLQLGSSTCSLSWTLAKFGSLKSAVESLLLLVFNLLRSGR